MDNNQNISKGFFGFGKKSSPGASRSGVSPPRQGLVKKQIIDSRGRRQTKWVRPQDIQTPIERKREDAKAQRKKITHLSHSEEDKKLIEDITKRHKEFENKAKEQRKIFGGGPQLPKPGLIMRVYARGKVNVGGMLAEVQRIAEDGKSVIAMLTSGKTYEFPLEQLHFAKSLLHYEIGKRGGLIIGRDKDGKPIYGDPEKNIKYNEILFEGTERISQAVGFEVSKISLNANHIMKKHPEYFKHPEQVKKLVKYVLNNPTHFLPATKTNYTMVISEKNNRVAVIELKPASQTGKSVVRSALIFGKDQLKVKLEKERQRQVGSQFPQVLGESIKKSNGITIKVLDGLTSHRSDTLRILSNAILKKQLKKIGDI